MTFTFDYLRGEIFRGATKSGMMQQNAQRFRSSAAWRRGMGFE